MTDGPEQITAQDRDDAQTWVLRMLDEPEHHAQGLADWIAEKPVREAVYINFMSDVQAAGRAGAAICIAPTHPRRPRPWWAKPIPVLIAASILGLLGSASMVLRTPAAPAPQIAGSAPSPAYVTKLGEVRTVSLADGSTVVLDTDTALAVVMTAERRNIVLKRGRARFTVAHNAERPFFVRAGGIQVRATGTVFDVLYRNSVAVHLIEGGVEVKMSAPNAGAPKMLALRPGQIFALSHGQSAQSLVMPARRSDQQWVNGVKSFDNVPIREVIAEANSYSSSRIELRPSSLGDREIFADIDIRDIERVAEAISGYLDLHIDRSQKDQLVLTTKK